MTYFVDILGWVGAFGVLIAYYWSSNNKVGNTMPAILKYQAVNVLGAVGLLANSFYYGAVPSVIVNLIWVAIAVLSLSKFSKEQAFAQQLEKTT